MEEQAAHLAIHGQQRVTRKTAAKLRINHEDWPGDDRWETRALLLMYPRKSIAVESTDNDRALAEVIAAKEDVQVLCSRRMGQLLDFRKYLWLHTTSILVFMMVLRDEYPDVAFLVSRHIQAETNKGVCFMFDPLQSQHNYAIVERSLVRSVVHCHTRNPAKWCLVG
ncbi:uncharacterized protein PITG_13136 [Phytophthora infestans T30-4]|uniref:Uncharacterized protein n=1 Tax=Phytophthora infestans (strain T30-4) TaxID=403677 RepID=D0NJN8_PHYIT|nr:uncharacterized protein PITG_13136 [Phytophthora infestans T30-4]EEY59974.1 hypothetical protein PITG_13136 [Phytophthora infestans T30-4]|eukprot:XP_002900659.1 hypothetical protein PITG_13136 [Phytophthora infestans T30-4]